MKSSWTGTGITLQGLDFFYERKDFKSHLWALQKVKAMLLTYMAVSLWLISVTFHYFLKSSFLFGYLEQKRLLKTEYKHEGQAAQVHYVAFWGILLWIQNLKIHLWLWEHETTKVFLGIPCFLSTKAFCCLWCLGITPLLTFLPVALKIKERKYYKVKKVFREFGNWIP